MAAPEPGTRVSSLTLSVRIDFKLQPYQVPTDCGLDNQLLHAALKHEGGNTTVAVLEATDSKPWVYLQPVFVRANGEETVSSSDTEARYRKAVADAGREASQDDFLAFAVAEITGIQIGSL